MRIFENKLSEKILAAIGTLLGALYWFLRDQFLDHIETTDNLRIEVESLSILLLIFLLLSIYLFLKLSYKITRFKYTKDEEKGFYIHKRTEIKICPRCLQKPECFENQLSRSPNGLKCDSCNWEVDTRIWNFYKMQPTVMPTEEAPREPVETNKEANENLDDNDIISILESWMGHRDARLNTKVIRYCDVDRELNLPDGSTLKHVEKAAQRYDYVVVRKGDTTILFKENPNKYKIGRRTSWWDREF
jgi:hypothetical protein